MPMEPSDPDDDLLTPREVAQIFGVRTTTIARWSRTGMIRSSRTPGGHRRYRRGDVHAFLGQNERPESPEEKRISEDAVRLYSQGWPIRRVAQEFEMSYGTMRRLLLRHTMLRDRSTAGR